jgi:phage-related protein
MAVKPVVWLGSSRMDVQRFPKDARQVVGHELFQVQQGLAPGN